MNIFSKIEQYFADIDDRRAEKKKREDIKRVNDSIHIYERDGGIYITVSGTAVIRMDDNATCKEAADTLHSMRLAARDYIMGKKSK